MKNKTPEFTIVERGCKVTRNRCTFRQMIKALVKKAPRTADGKFLLATLAGWKGRVIVTVNTDPGDIRMLPSLDEAIAAKRKS